MNKNFHEAFIIRINNLNIINSSINWKERDRREKGRQADKEKYILP